MEDFKVNRSRPAPGAPYEKHVAYVQECVEEAKAHPDRAEWLRLHVYETVLTYLRGRNNERLIDAAFSLVVPEPIADPYERFVKERYPDAVVVAMAAPVVHEAMVGMHFVFKRKEDAHSPIRGLGYGPTREEAWKHAARLM